MKQRWDDGVVANIERDGKYVFGTLTLGDYVVTERIPLHVMHLPKDKQAEHFAEVQRRLHKKLFYVVHGGRPA